jgi:hypothetical protein
MISRKLAYKRYHRFYKLVCRDKICVYCGIRSTTIDHFVPLSVVNMISDAIDYIEGKVLLPACGECNSIAAANVFRTVAAKRRFIHERLQKRYRRVLDMPVWTETELGEMDYGLRDFIQKGLRHREWIEARLKWRNTSNREAVKLAGIRSPLGANGRSSAVNPTGRLGTGKSEKRCSKLTGSTAAS